MRSSEKKQLFILIAVTTAIVVSVMYIRGDLQSGSSNYVVITPIPPTVFYYTKHGHGPKYPGDDKDQVWDDDGFRLGANCAIASCTKKYTFKELWKSCQSREKRQAAIMSIVQIKGAGGNVALDRTSFVGARVPSEIHAMIKQTKGLEKDVFTKILKIIVSVIQGKQPQYDKLKPLINEVLTPDRFAVLYCGIDLLVRKALRLPVESLKKEHFIQDLQELQLPEQFHEDLVKCVFGSIRSQIDQQLVDSRPRLPSLENLDWRVDVTISTGVLNRVLVRGVTMGMTLSDGSMNNFEMSISKFQDLRFQVASVLAEMERLEKRSILKIKD